MAQINDTQMKTKFENGDIPTQSDFYDFIDSKVNNTIENNIKVNLPGNPSIITVDGNIIINNGAAIKDKNGNVLVNDTGTIAGMSDKEDKSNKENTTLDTSITKYPTNRLVKQEIDISRIASNISTNTTGVDVQEALDSKENLLNKENTTLDTSITKYPTNRLVKQEIDISRIASNISTSQTGLTVQDHINNAVVTLPQLQDVTLTSPANGESLVYDENISQWKNGIGVVEGQTEIEINGVRKSLLWKTFTGNTGTGGSVYVAHGLTRANILTVTAKINYTTAIDYYFQQDAGQFYTRTDDTNVAIEAIDSMYNNSPYIITISYYADYVPAIKGGVVGLGSDAVGFIKEIGGENVPEGYLLCDGKTIARDVGDIIYPDGSGSSAPDYYGAEYSTLYTKLSEAGNRWGTPIPTGDVPVWGTHKIKLPNLVGGVFVIKYVEPRLVTVLTNPVSITKTSSYIILDTDLENVYYFETGINNLTCTLPTASDNTDREILVMKSDGGAGKISVIDEVAIFNYDVELQDYGVKVKSNGTKWVIIERINAIVPDSQNIFRETIIDGGFSQWSLRRDQYIREAQYNFRYPDMFISTSTPHYLSASSRIIPIKSDDIPYTWIPSYGSVYGVNDSNNFYLENAIITSSYYDPQVSRQGKFEYITSDQDSDVADYAYTGVSWTKSGTTITLDSGTIKQVIPGTYINVYWISTSHAEFPHGLYKIETVQTFTKFTITVPLGTGTGSGTCDFRISNKPKKASDIFYSYAVHPLFSGRSEDKPSDLFDSSLRLVNVDSLKGDTYIGQVIEGDTGKFFKGNKRVSLSAYIKTDGIIPANTIKYKFRSGIEDRKFYQKAGALSYNSAQATPTTGHITGSSAILFNGNGSVGGMEQYFGCAYIQQDAVINDFTATVWIYADSTQTTGGGMFVNYMSDSDNTGWFWEYNKASNIIRFYHWATGANVSIGAPEGWYPDTWNHVSIVKSSSEGMKIYLNGILKTTNSTANAKSDFGQSSYNSMVIGASLPNGSYRFKGYLEDLRLYNRPLTDSEILEIYNDTLTDSLNNNQSFHNTSCFHWFKLNETTGTNLLDSASPLLGRNIPIPDELNKNRFEHKCNPDYTINPAYHDRVAHGIVNNTPSQNPSFVAGRLTGYNCAEFTSANVTHLDTILPSAQIWHGTWTKPFTFSFWFKPKTLSLGHEHAILSDYQSQNEHIQLGIDVANKLYFYIRNVNGNWMHVTSTNALTTTDWVHLTIVYPGFADARRFQMYYNGIKQPLTINANGAANSNIVTSSSYSYYIGCHRTGGGTSDCYLEDLRLYEYELTGEDVAELYSTTLTTPYAVNQSFNKLPIHQWKFDEPNGSTIAYDSTPKWVADYNDNIVEGTFTHEIINDWVKITAENILLPDSLHWEQGFEVNIIIPQYSIDNPTGITLNDVWFSGVHMNEGTIDRGVLPEDINTTKKKVERFYKKYFMTPYEYETTGNQTIVAIGGVKSDWWAHGNLPLSMLKYPTLTHDGMTGAIPGATSFSRIGSTYMNLLWSKDRVFVQWYGNWGNYIAWEAWLSCYDYWGWAEIDGRII